MSAPMKPVDLTVVDTRPRSGRPLPAINANLEHVPLINDPETGMMVVKMVYRAGFTNTWHTHPCGHGIYVLDGTLNTHQGDFRPGSFVWFPEGGTMEHGATAGRRTARSCSSRTRRSTSTTWHRARPGRPDHAGVTRAQAAASRPSRRSPDQAAPSFTTLLRQCGGEVFHLPR